MLVIGHRGSNGTEHENTIPSLREAIRVGADIVEFDVRTTKDHQVVLSHDFHMWRTQKKLDYIRRHTLSELQKQTAGSEYPIVTLEKALSETYGKIIVNIEIKSLAAVKPMLKVVKKFVKNADDWDNILFSSFYIPPLRSLRKQAPHASLALLHLTNSLRFIAWHRTLNFTAVGFHRLNINSLALEMAKRLNIFTYAYTVNRPDAARKLLQRGIDGIVTDYPELLLKADI